MRTAGFGEWQLSAKTDVVAKILETAHRARELGQEDISGDAYLSRPETSEYLSLMTRNDLLKYNAHSKTYKTTRKGDAFLRTYQQLGDFISMIDEEIGL